MIRVLIADDSPTARALLTGILGSDDGLEIIGQANDGLEALRMAKSLRPDVITMDVTMPRMDGLEATRRIMDEAPTPIVIVSASSIAQDVNAAMEAVRSGALTVASKPIGPADPDFEAGARRLVETIKAMAAVKVVRRWPTTFPVVPAAPAEDSEAGPSCRLIALAASTGGPAALRHILARLPASFPAPVLVVQHIALGFGEGFASWLDDVCALSVKVAVDGEPLLDGRVYLAPDDAHLGLRSRRAVSVVGTPPVRGYKPSATHLFQSAARAFGRDAVGVILTGMGDDGVEGLRELRAAGAQVIAQDEATSVVFGMPAAAIAAGTTHRVLSLDAIADYISRCATGSGDPRLPQVGAPRAT
jgi:two-component system, chemotaxis family, protein-glutamate methylesterase/glutaminase